MGHIISVVNPRGNRFRKYAFSFLFFFISMTSHARIATLDDLCNIAMETLGIRDYVVGPALKITMELDVCVRRPKSEIMKEENLKILKDTLKSTTELVDNLFLDLQIPDNMADIKDRQDGAINGLVKTILALNSELKNPQLESILDFFPITDNAAAYGIALTRLGDRTCKKHSDL